MITMTDTFIFVYLSGDKLKQIFVVLSRFNCRQSCILSQILTAH